MTMLSRPTALAAERALIGSCLVERDAILAVSWLSPDAFALERHAVIWRAILDCLASQTPPDLVTVYSALQRAETAEADLAGGLSYLGELAELAAAEATAYHVEHYAADVARVARARALIETGGQIAALGYRDAVEAPEAAFDTAERLLFAVTQGAAAPTFQPLGRVAGEVLEYLSGQDDPAVPSGLPDLDEAIIGWRPSRLYVVAARPGMGKTGFGLTAAYHAARAGCRVGFFSLEMDRIEIGFRLAAYVSGISSQRIEARRLGGDDHATVITALAQIADLPLVISDLSGETIAAVRGKARREHAAQPLDLVVVDYLQLMESGGGADENRVQAVGAVVRGLKNLARELRVPVLALAQLNRAVEGRASKVPQLSDLRESGEIEQSADAVLFIHRPAYYDKTDQPGVAELHIAKQRNGPLRMVPTQFDAPSTLFRPLARETPEGY